MHVRLISYATPEYYNNQKRLQDSAKRTGFNNVICYRERDLRNTQFYCDNAQILWHKKGSGFWLWKPHLILQNLSALSDGDVVIYADCSVVILRDLLPLIDLCLSREGILLFRNHGLKNHCWTKRDCFVLMGCDSDLYYEAEQVKGTICLFAKSKKAVMFVKEWLYYAQIPEVLTDAPNTRGLPNLPGFVAHRHDQSILSLLTIKWNLEVFRDPSQEGNHMKLVEYRHPGEYIAEPYNQHPLANSSYGTLITIDRDRHNSIVKKLYFRAHRIVADWHRRQSL